jgi:AcrR family transcriptional regulator
MAHPRFYNLDPQRQQHIIEVAGQELARSGYKGSSLNAIIEAAGLSKGAFYYYFDSKEDLLVTTLQHVSGAIFQGDTPDLSGLTADTFWPMLRAMSQRSYDFGRDHGWAVKLGKVLQQERDHLGPTVQRFLAAVVSVLEGFLRRGQALGVIRADLPLDLLVAICQALDQAIDRWVAARWADTPPADMERTIALLLDMTQQLLSPPPPPEACR